MSQIRFQGFKETGGLIKLTRKTTPLWVSRGQTVCLSRAWVQCSCAGKGFFLYNRSRPGLKAMHLQIIARLQGQERQLRPPGRLQTFPPTESPCQHYLLEYITFHTARRQDVQLRGHHVMQETRAASSRYRHSPGSLLGSGECFRKPPRLPDWSPSFTR